MYKLLFHDSWVNTIPINKGLYYWISIAIKMQLLQIFNNCKYSIESYAIALLHYCNRIWEKSAIMEMQYFISSTLISGYKFSNFLKSLGN